MIALVPVQIHLDAAQVVVMREETRTVMTVQPWIRGPDAPFTLVVPVPGAVVGDVTVLPDDVIDRVERVDAPRLVAYDEKDPCVPDPLPVWMPPPVPAPAAPVEARVAAGGYEIAVVSADGLPADAAPQLRPYLDGGWQFVVAKVDHVTDRLPPLRIVYDSEELVLPVGSRDLIVHVLAPTRYQVANRTNAFVETNLDLPSPAAFAATYAALFERARPAVVTEYAGPASLDPSDLETLGGDVVGDTAGLVLTRLHVGADGEDLALVPALAVEGGREVRGADGALDHGARAGDTADFQARYAVRRAWSGPIRCEEPYPPRWRAAGEPVLALDLPHTRAAALPDAAVPSGRASSSRAGCSAAPEPGGLLLLALLLLRRRS